MGVKLNCSSILFKTYRARHDTTLTLTEVVLLTCVLFLRKYIHDGIWNRCEYISLHIMVYKTYNFIF